MVRGLIVGALAFGAAFGAERLFASMGPDIQRYNRIRAMSGQGPLAQELLATAGSLLGGSLQGGAAGSFIGGLTDDIVRYAKMKGM